MGACFGTEARISDQNIEAVRRTYEVFVARHEPPWELFTDDATMDATEASPDVLVIRSRAEATAALRSYADTFERYNVVLDEIIHADDTRVVTTVRDGGRIKGSDTELWNRFFHVFTFRDGKIAWWSTHTEHGSALRAAGLGK
jgi:ketosteroid isomerase-like protein